MTGPRRDENTGIFHYRRRVPDKVRKAMKAVDARAPKGSPKTFKLEEKKSLGRDPLRAKELWKSYNREVEARWRQLQLGPTRLRIAQRQAIAGEVYRDTLKRYGPNRASSDFAIELMRRAVTEKEEELRDDRRARFGDAYRLYLEGMHGRVVGACLAKHGIELAEEQRFELLEAAHRTFQHGLDFALKRLHGETRPDPESERYPAWPDPALNTLRGLVGAWANSKNPKRDTQRSFRSSIERFIAFVGHDQVKLITQNDVRRWCKSLEEEKDASGKRKFGGIRIRDGHLSRAEGRAEPGKARGRNSDQSCGRNKHRNRASSEHQRKGSPRRRGVRDTQRRCSLSASSGGAVIQVSTSSGVVRMTGIAFG